jgi:hypothetical protein
VILLLNAEEAPFEQIRAEDDPMRLAVAAAFQEPELAEQVIIPVVDDDFSASSLGDLPDDIRALARQLFVPIDWEQMAAGASSLMKCVKGVRADKISPVLEMYLRTVIKQTETFPDPCTQEKIHTETQCVPLKLLTMSEIEESRVRTQAISLLLLVTSRSFPERRLVFACDSRARSLRKDSVSCQRSDCTYSSEYMYACITKATFCP